jgi:hypothetical protein
MISIDNNISTSPKIKTMRPVELSGFLLQIWAPISIAMEPNISGIKKKPRIAQMIPSITSPLDEPVLGTPTGYELMFISHAS